MVMNVGVLDNRIEIQEKSVSQHAITGQDVVTWATVATVFAHIQDAMPSRAEQVLSGSMETAVNRTRVRIRWRSGMTSAYRFKVLYPTERYLQIIGGPAEIGGRKAYLEFMCEQVSTLG